MRKEKQLLVEEIQEKIERSESMVITQYKKLDPNFSWKFSQDLRKVGAEFEVIKKRVFQKAAAEKGIEMDLAKSKGHIGVLFIYGKSLDGAKILYTMGEEVQDSFTVVSGCFEGRSYGAQDVMRIAKLPPLNELRAQILGIFEAPMSRTLAVINSLLCSVVHCLENKSKK